MCYGLTRNPGRLPKLKRKNVFLNGIVFLMLTAKVISSFLVVRSGLKQAQKNFVIESYTQRQNYQDPQTGVHEIKYN